MMYHPYIDLGKHRYSTPRYFGGKFLLMVLSFPFWLVVAVYSVLSTFWGLPYIFYLWLFGVKRLIPACDSCGQAIDEPEAVLDWHANDRKEESKLDKERRAKEVLDFHLRR